METQKGLIKYIKLLYIKVDTDGATVPTDTSGVSERLKEKINYYMGVPLEKLEGVNTLGSLINVTNDFRQKSELDEIIEEDLLKYLDLQSPRTAKSFENPMKREIKKYIQE